METVCLALERDNNLFAVGSQSHVSFYDPRSGTAVGYIGSRDPGAGESRRGGKETLSFLRGSGNLPFFPGCLIKAIESRSTDQYYCFGLPTALFFCCLPCSNTVRLKKNSLIITSS